MPLFGTLKTMPLTDLLQWLGTARQSGVLQVERNKVSKRIVFDEGRIVGCSSDDPPQRLGQFLIARGKISESQLREALSSQERVRRHLGMILVEMGAIAADELAHHLEAKAEETILSMFDWPEAVFRFQEGARDEANALPVRLRVEDVLLRGVKRYDEIRRIREVLNDPAIVLRRTAKVPPPAMFESEMAKSLYDAIDGERTLADIRLHVHGSEYVVHRYLFDLQRSGYAEITGLRQPLPDAVAPASEIDDADLDSLLPELDDPPGEVDRPLLGSSGEDAAPAPPGTGAAAAPTVPRPTDAARAATVAAPAEAAESSAGALERRLQQARAAMNQGDFESALDTLDELYRQFPADESLRRLSTEAELAFIEKAYRHYLPPFKVLSLIKPIEDLASQNVSPTEFFLLSRIDGTWDVKSIIQIAPLREVDTLRTLKRMREAGAIELRDPPA